MAMEDLFGVDGQPGSIWTIFTNPSVSWDTFKNGRSNIINKEIADANLEMQKEEQKWQRDFALNERDYNRALQQEIFNREDTAVLRQAEQLSKLGVNPLSQQLNGSQSGAVVSGVSPNSVTPQNGFVAQDKGLMEAITPILSLVNGISNLNTQGLQRDSIREQNDYQRLLNQEKALENRFLENKLTQEEEARAEENRHKKEQNPSTELKERATAERVERENQFQKDFGVTDNSSTVARIATDTTKQGLRFLDGVGQISDTVGNVSKNALSALTDGATKKINEYKKSLKNTIESGKAKYKKVKDWFKSHSYSGDELQNYMTR